MGISLRTPSGRFRLIAFAEAVSWAGLLVGMFFKRAVIENDLGVSIFGPVHGALFLGYLVIALATWTTLRWGTRTGVLGLLAGIPPFGSVVFERWATRSGHLDDDRAEPVTA